MTKPKTKSTFLVRFLNVGAARVTFEFRVERPVTDERLGYALRRYLKTHRGILASKLVGCEETGDYGGYVTAGDRVVGRYLIVPGSEVEVQQGPRS